ncbi:MAG: tRNA (adenosine(37)-N6)-dimethylallyltransferase MiaA [Rikenellaceae bacterium]
MSNQKSLHRNRLIVIVGPTGSGKSSLSLHVAKHFAAPIISTDSRQFYRGIPIGTAQPTAEELAEVEHHFIACRELADDYNAGEYEHDALERLDQLFERYDTVVAVGGSGLYIKALCEGLDSLPEVSDAVRNGVREEYSRCGLEPLLAELQRLDPEYYEVVDRCNSARVMRALEICRSSGSNYSSLRCGEAAERPFEIVKVGLDLPRAELYDRINCRVDQMVADGLIEEVRGVYALRSLNSLQSVGYTELFAHFDGEYDLERALELIKRNSRRYAKRQMTWFRRDKSIEWFEEFSPETVINYLESEGIIC